jgi:hypothetical protein
MVGTLSGDGFTPTDAGLDAPSGDGDWPNARLGLPPSVKVWLR